MKLFSIFDKQVPGPRAERVRHESKVRAVQVGAVERLTPGMLRITFTGDELSDFVSLSPDDHLKLLVPTLTGEIVRRDYTPRRYDQQAKTLVIDFAIHEAGPATLWALDAKPGDTIQIGGPKSSSVLPSDIRRWLLVGDETALPAIGRRIEEAPAGTSITSIVAVPGPKGHQTFDTVANLTTHWAHRPLSSASDPKALLDILKTIVLEPETFAWVAAEAHVARAVRSWLIEQSHPKSWLKAGGYWVVGKADAHDRLDY
ncbi:siderophore-interacting protein [Pseudomonas aeruginosa]|uniref:siderophore-interacting protein n=1 Tax=Pseudomonas aeruginosa TaxID=287 RepID=UPI000BAA6B37|nr:siderophore-interacting protein [Pseudomonas aeruginosa]PAT49839.1 NADPH-dependent ferric siderophore reductase [Pseudomonas aeruginosa]PCA38862.1 NADPH-dependent ferric siderophore reductase [Pseudomonas aeruginosa]PCA40936.1 NADPH-dependent ferric siderophore reductase [Pseudomonas aeruginosa]